MACHNLFTLMSNNKKK